MSILIAFALASSAPPVVQTDEAMFRECVTLISSDADAAIAFAGRWRVDGGNVLARQCLGMAYAAQEKWASAMTAFEQAGNASETAKDGRAAGIWVQAGNAALAAEDAVRARGYFDAALILGTLTGADAGLTHLDRARALVAVGDPIRARADLDMAVKLVPEDPLAWLLSATLARRAGDLGRAQMDIGEAVKRAADDPSVALEAGNIAALLGHDAAAQTAWEAAARLAPESPQGKAAQRALEQFGGEVPASTPPKP